MTTNPELDFDKKYQMVKDVLRRMRARGSHSEISRALDGLLDISNEIYVDVKTEEPGEVDQDYDQQQ
jgi:hypothetical protein